MRALLYRLGGFASLPLISAITPLLILPIVARAAGPEGWASFAIAQAFGAFGATVVSYGWTVGGPSIIAQLRSERAAFRTYTEAFLSRSTVATVALPGVALLAASVGEPESATTNVLVAVSMAMNGFSPAWYLIGRGSPLAIAFYDTLPKLGGTALAALGLALGAPILLYPIVLMVTVVSSLTVFHVRTFGRALIVTRTQISAVPSLLWTGRTTALIEIAGAAYVSSPVPISALSANVSEVAAYASTDKIYRYGLVAVTAVANALQGWVVSPLAFDQRKRQRFALLAHVGVGVLGFGVLALAGVFATRLLFGAEAQGDSRVMLWLGVAYLAISVSTPLMRNLLIPAGKARLVLVSTLAAGLLGIPVMLLGGSVIGASGVALGLAASEVAVTLILLVPAIGCYLGLPRRRY